MAKFSMFRHPDGKMSTEPPPRMASGRGMTSQEYANVKAGKPAIKFSPLAERTGAVKPNLPGNVAANAQRISEGVAAKAALKAQRASDARGKDPATQVTKSGPAKWERDADQRSLQKSLDIAKASREAGNIARAEEFEARAKEVQARIASYSGASSVAAGGSPVGNVGTKSAGKVGGGGADDQPRDEQGRWV